MHSTRETIRLLRYIEDRDNNPPTSLLLNNANAAFGLATIKYKEARYDEARGFMKIVIDAQTRQILGAAILGVGGDEAIHSILDVMYAKAPYTVIQRAMHAEIIGIRELQFLMRAANCERGVVKLSGIESSRNPDVIFQSLRELTVKLQTAFTPGARDNARFDEIAFHAIVSRRLVRFVEYAKRDQKLTQQITVQQPHSARA